MGDSEWCVGLVGGGESEREGGDNMKGFKRNAEGRDQSLAQCRRLKRDGWGRSKKKRRT